MARLSANKGEQQVRLGFQLFASDNPLLVAELLKLRKGRSPSGKSANAWRPEASA